MANESTPNWDTYNDIMNILQSLTGYFCNRINNRTLLDILAVKIEDKLDVESFGFKVFDTIYTKRFCSEKQAKAIAIACAKS